MLFYRSFEVLASKIPVPDIVPPVHYEINEYLAFDLKFPAIWAGLYLAYYFILDPIAAVCIDYLYRNTSLKARLLRSSTFLCLPSLY